MKKKNVLFALAALLATGCGQSIEGTYVGTPQQQTQGMYGNNFNNLGSQGQQQMTFSNDTGSQVTAQWTDQQSGMSATGTLSHNDNSVSGTLSGTNGQQVQFNLNCDGSSITGTTSGGTFGTMGGGSNVNLKCQSGNCNH